MSRVKAIITESFVSISDHLSNNRDFNIMDVIKTIDFFRTMVNFKKSIPYTRDIGDIGIVTKATSSGKPRSTTVENRTRPYCRAGKYVCEYPRWKNVAAGYCIYHIVSKYVLEFGEKNDYWELVLPAICLRDHKEAIEFCKLSYRRTRTPCVKNLLPSVDYYEDDANYFKDGGKNTLEHD